MINKYPLLPTLESISEVLYEKKLHNRRNQPPSQIFYQSSNSGQVTLNKIISKENDDVFIPSTHHFLNIPIQNQMLSTSKLKSSTIFQSHHTE